jgi:hypothetical protein
MKKTGSISLSVWHGLLVVCMFASPLLKAQDIDSIAFHLYTDSLKKGVQNYINVDGWISEGRWVPLSGKDLHFTSTSGKFEGNNLVIDPGFTGEKVSITATYTRKLNLSISTSIFIKTVQVNEQLKTVEEVIQPNSTGKKSRKKQKGNP